MAGGINKEYKDRLFKFVFGNPEHKNWTLSLYNAMNGADYADENDLEINTVEDVVYMRMKNDVSFLIGDTINLYEQQSSYNPNMPARFLIYFGMLCAKYFETHRIDLHASSLQLLPTPRFVCFFNGSDRKIKGGRETLRLSKAFREGTRPDVEATVLMIDINYGRNKKLLNACEPLMNYSWFVHRITRNLERILAEENQQTMPTKQESGRRLRKAVDQALDEMPDDFVIKKFLLENRAEVKRMCITEYNEQLHLELEREIAEKRGLEQGREQGLKQGLKQGREQGLEQGLKRGSLLTLADLVQDGIITLAQAAKKAKMTKKEFEAKLKALQSEPQLT